MSVMLSNQQKQYLSWLLTKKSADNSIDSLASTLIDSQVDLNPHQVDAALFAFKNPLSQGVLLADEVGLGKTIEAGLVIAQTWAERKKRILIITPANLRKQWYQELYDKFGLKAVIFEAKIYTRWAKTVDFSCVVEVTRFINSSDCWCFSHNDYSSRKKIA